MEALPNTHDIHKRGVELIQCRLLKYGIQPDPGKTRTGIDFVASVPQTGDAFTVQVKACLRPIPAGGKGPPSLGWWLRKKSVADLVALTNLDGDKAWLFSCDEFKANAIVLDSLSASQETQGFDG